MRLDKLLANATALSRSQVKSAIKKGRVTVNNLVVKDPSIKISQNDEFRLNNQLIEFPQKQYYLLHKPAGYICSTVDEEYPSALKLLPLSYKPNFHFAGRLDQDTTGLVLITNDGDWSHRVTSPRKKCAKSYEVILKAPVSSSDIGLLAKGLMLKGEAKATLPAKVAMIHPNHIILTIYEGRYHQVKRMLAALNNRVESLHRLSIGELSLNGLKQGEWRKLTENEVALF